MLITLAVVHRLCKLCRGRVGFHFGIIRARMPLFVGDMLAVVVGCASIVALHNYGRSANAKRVILMVSGV